MSTTNPQEVKAALGILQAVAEAIRDLREVPSGTLYAILMAKMDIEMYQRVIAGLKGAGLIREEDNLLIWIGPEKEIS